MLGGNVLVSHPSVLQLWEGLEGGVWAGWSTLEWGALLGALGVPEGMEGRGRDVGFSCA